MNVHKSVGDLLAFVATAIREGKPVDPKLAKYALDTLEGRFVPLAKGMNACATGFPEVCDVAFDFAGVPTWIARDKDGSAFAFRGFGPNGGPGSLIETPKNWHVELVHGIENDVPVVAWPKTCGMVFDVRWNEHHRLITNVQFVPSNRYFALWKDGNDRRFVAAFGLHEGSVVCLDDQSLDRRVELGSHMFVKGVVERGGRAWIIALNHGTGLDEIVDDQGETLGTGPENCVDVAVQDGKPTLVKTVRNQGIQVGDTLFKNARCSMDAECVACRHVLDRGRAVVLIDEHQLNLVDALTGVRYETYGLPGIICNLAATGAYVFVAGGDGRLLIHSRTTGLRTEKKSGVRTQDPFRQFNNNMCVAFENGNWHFFDEAHREWDTGIPSTERIQLLHDGRAATWKFVDGTLYTRVVEPE